MPSKTITVTNGDGSTKTITIPDRSRFAGTRTMSRVTGGVADNITVDRTAQVVTSDRKGESRPLLTKVVGGASAAYSLRDLNDRAGNNKVVRVRRASDNHEKDFRAKEVKDIATWVNTQAVLPLDIQELESDGRTGDVISASAAYSLRNLSSTYTGNVVVVRRSSDDAEELFTAAEVADGTLTTWVNAVETVGAESNFSSTISPYNLYQADGSTASLNETIGGETGALKITSQGGSSHLRYLGSITNLSVNTTIKISIKVYIPSSNTSLDGLTFSLPNFTVTSGQRANTIPTDTWTTVTVEGTSSDLSPSNSWRIYPRNRSAGDVIYLKNYRITQDIADGYVVIWYDQSGNGNHATQTTNASQPKIVDGGSLVTRGENSKPSILFGGAVDNRLDVVGRPIAKSVFSALQASNTNFETLICDTNDNTPRLTTNNNANNRAYKFEGFGTPSVNVDGVTYNGTSNVSSLGFHLLGMTSGSGSSINRIGANPSTGSTGNSFNYVSELILYASDQSDNRTAFEANIGETYGIDLPSGVDTGYDQVDGFVETWYDQSGNGNDATQSVAGSQPKIVDAGVLVSGGIYFDGSPSAMDIDGLVLESTEYYMTAVIHLDAVPSNSLKTIFDCTDAVNAGASLAYANTSSQLTPFMFDGDDTSVNVFGGGANLTTSKTLVGCQFKSGASESYINGGINSTLSNTWTSAGTNTFTKSTIGYDQSTPGRNMDGKLAELIVYESDQSANRAAIEANINNQYDIY